MSEETVNENNDTKCSLLVVSDEKENEILWNWKEFIIIYKVLSLDLQLLKKHFSKKHFLHQIFN